jgi:hypothetical protein
MLRTVHFVSFHIFIQGCFGQRKLRKALVESVITGPRNPFINLPVCPVLSGSTLTDLTFPPSTTMAYRLLLFVPSIGAEGNSMSSARVKSPPASPRNRMPLDLLASRDLPQAFILQDISYNLLFHIHPRSRLGRDLHECVIDRDNEDLSGARQLGMLDEAGNVAIGACWAFIASAFVLNSIDFKRCQAMSSSRRGYRNDQYHQREGVRLTESCWNTN